MTVNILSTECSRFQIRCNASGVHEGSSADDFYCLSRATYGCDWVTDCPQGEDEDAELCRPFDDSDNFINSKQARVVTVRKAPPIFGCCLFSLIEQL